MDSSSFQLASRLHQGAFRRHLMQNFIFKALATAVALGALAGPALAAKALNPALTFGTGVGNRATIQFTGGQQINDFKTRRQKQTWKAKVSYENGSGYFEGRLER